MTHSDETLAFKIPGIPAYWLIGCLGVGALIAVVYTLSPLTVVAAAVVPLLFRLAAAGLPRDEARGLLVILAAALVLRILLLLGLLLVSDHDSQAVAILAGDEAYSLSRTLRIRNILLGVPGLKHDYQIAFEEYGETSYLGMLTVLQVLFGPAPYGLRLVNVLLFVAGAALLFRLARHAYGRLPSLLALGGIVLLPTLLLWSISVLKESLYFALTACVVTGTYAAIRGRRLAVRFAALGSALLALLALSDLRAGAVVLVGGGVAIGLVAFFATANVRRLAISTLVVMFAAAALVSRPAVRDRAHTAIEQAALIHRGHVFTTGHAYKTLDEGFYVTLALDIQLTSSEAARYVARSLAAFALQPWPWRMRGRNELAFLPEHVLWYLALLLVPVGIGAGLRRDRLATCLLIGVIVPSSVVVALTNGNVGTLVRFRGLVWPYVSVLAALGACVAVQWLLQRSAGQFATVEQALSRSGIAAGGRWAQHAIRTAFATSQLRAALASLNQAWRAFTAPCVRFAGFALLSFVAVHTMLLFWVPDNVAPAMPSGLWLVVGLFALILIAVPDALVRAWQLRRASHGRSAG